LAHSKKSGGDVAALAPDNVNRAARFRRYRQPGCRCWCGGAASLSDTV